MELSSVDCVGVGDGIYAWLKGGDSVAGVDALWGSANTLVPRQSCVRVAMTSGKGLVDSSETWSSLGYFTDPFAMSSLISPAN